MEGKQPDEPGPALPASVLILGGGIAGSCAAQAIRQAGRDVRVTLLSEESEPVYSACVLAEYLAGEIPRERVFIRNRGPSAPETWRELRGRKAVRIELHRKRVELENGEPLPFDKLVLATGSRPLVPPWPGVDKAGVFALKTLEDADRIIRAPGNEAVVVGSGPIGLEAALALRARGWRVTVLELMESLLPRLFPPVLARMLQSLLERQGVRVLLGERVREIAGGARVEAVRTDRRTLPCRLALLAVGMRPEAGLAEQAGIRIGPSGGIAVDQTMRTSHPDVFACGDCAETVDRLTGRAGLNMLWANAKTQGATAGQNCLGLGRRYPGALNLTTLKLLDTVAASVGEIALADESCQEILSRHGDRCTVRLVTRDGLIRGIQAVGPHLDMSVFLNMLLNGERLHSLRESGDKRVLIGRKPWLVRLPARLRE